MKLQIRNVIGATLMAIVTLTMSCGTDKTDFYTPDNTVSPDDSLVDPSQGVGYLALSDLALFVDVESENLNNDDYLVDDTKASTKSVEADDDYIIIINKVTTDSDTQQVSYTEVYRKSYSEAKSSSEGIELSVGQYNILARSCSEGDIPLLGTTPEYASKYYDFEISTDKTTTLSDSIICTLANVKSSIEMSIDLISNFDVYNTDQPLTVTLSYGVDEDGNTLSKVFTYDEIISADNSIYFSIQDSYTTMTITLNGVYNIAPADEDPEWIEVTWSQNITGIDQGQYRVITINYANYNDGKIHIEFQIQSWTYGSSIGVNLLSSSFATNFEAEIIDPDEFVSDVNSVVATLDGGLNIADTYEINPDTFASSASTYSPDYSVILTPYDGAKVISVQLQMISAANTEFTAALTEAGFGSTINLWGDAASDNISAYISASEDTSTNVVTLNMLYDGMKAMSDYYGTYKMKLKVVDDQDRESNTLLTFNSSTLNIVWDGYDFGTRYEIWKDDEFTNEEMISVKFDMTSTTGFTATKIKIVSNILTDSVLASLNLAEEMDLVNPETTKMEDALKELGFPTGDDIEGLTSIEFDISSFMPLLAMLSDQGSGDETDFVITIEDISGSTSRTLMLKRR